jgi:hypothetical protein
LPTLVIFCCSVVLICIFLFMRDVEHHLSFFFWMCLFISFAHY